MSQQLFRAFEYGLAIFPLIVIAQLLSKWFLKKTQVLQSAITTLLLYFLLFYLGFSLLDYLIETIGYKPPMLLLLASQLMVCLGVFLASAYVNHAFFLDAQHHKLSSKKTLTLTGIQYLNLCLIIAHHVVCAAFLPMLD